MEYKDELVIVTGDEMESLKGFSLTLMKFLPADEMTALLVVTLLKEHIEQHMTKKVKAIKIK